MLALEGDIEVVGEVGDRQAAPDTVAHGPADVVLMDLRMPVMDGAAATAQIRARYPQTQELVLTTYDTDTDTLRAVEAGATGYLLKDTPRAQLIAGVRSAAAGRSVLSPHVAGRLVGHTRRAGEQRPTPREIQVLAAVARGVTNAEIGRVLFIGEATVKTYLLRVFGKLGVDDRTRAVTVAMERGLLPRPGEETRT